MSSKSRTLKTRTFQKISYFSKSCTFEKLNFQNLVLSKSRTFFRNDVLFKILHFEKLNFQNLVLSKSRTFKTRTFYRIPCLFQNFRVFKNSPFKVHLEFPTKIPCFFKNSPFRKKLTLQIPCFFSENSVFFTKFPGFQIF